MTYPAAVPEHPFHPILLVRQVSKASPDPWVGGLDPPFIAVFWLSLTQNLNRMLLLYSNVEL